MALTAGFDLASRIFLSILSLFITVKARFIYTFGTIAIIISRFGMDEIDINPVGTAR